MSPAVKRVTYSLLKEQEARRRMAAVRRARKGARSAKAEQRRASLVGNASKWQITNLRQVVNAMAKWA